MKNINLDNLQKKTPYRIPENFFSEMQNNVLKEAFKPQKKQTKFWVLNPSVITSLAAALALIFGFTFLWKTNQAEITKPSVTDDTVNSKNNAQGNTIVIKPNAGIETEKQSKEADKPIKDFPSSQELMATTDSDINYDQLINSLSEEEIAELTKDADQDVYLDLYN